MSAKPEDKLKYRLGPGAWVDENDNLHFNVPELLEVFELSDTPENRARMSAVCEEVFRETCKDTPIIRRP